MRWPLLFNVISTAQSIGMKEEDRCERTGLETTRKESMAKMRLEETRI